ncbi:MAG: hypothetical protein JO261_13110 [Alphaproteobacteria bacterium]|nr:hypothetical protein [Alphaproteobacteria bacterium]MBV9694631.1 hypothetical protein [Alphaproteobacteria bacterium]
MTRTASWLACLALSCAIARAADAPIVQDQSHFEQAVRSNSPAPYYVLATIVDDVKQTRWTGCTTATLLEGAVHFEHALDYDAAGNEQVREILLSATDHAYHFSNPRALANLRVDAYGSDDLQRARAYLRAHGTAFLLSTDWAKIEDANKLNRVALACAIIEHGLAARMSEGTAETFAEP